MAGKSGHIGFEPLPLPYPSTPAPPYSSVQNTYWDLCGGYTVILEDSWRFFCDQMYQDWTFKKQEKFLKIENRQSDKYRVKGLRMSGEFVSKNPTGFGYGSTMENLKHQLFGIESFKEMPSIDPKSVKLIEQPGINTNVLTYTEKYSWPMSSREYLTVEQIKKDPITGNFMIIGAPVTVASVPVKEKPIRAFQEYLFILENSKLNPNNVFGTFYVFFDICGDISPADQDSGIGEIVKMFLELPKYI
ncbi:hypothetical protein LOD99_14840 [Oopsacas minuta]|uniref:Uncharacterized protein n=1 Tax=Oopsacas minuta TaxID=111878 RepID=A0AAV7KE77_9METZ|nr:hypothetical protein LOD99_14840 [Oopsacas minuta]